MIENNTLAAGGVKIVAKQSPIVQEQVTFSLQEYQNHISIFFCLKSSAKRMLYQKKGDFAITKGLTVDRFTAGSCFVVSFDIIPDHKMDDFCNLMLLGEGPTLRKLGIWFEAKTTKLAIRVRTVCFFLKLRIKEESFWFQQPIRSIIHMSIVKTLLMFMHQLEREQV